MPGWRGSSTKKKQDSPEAGYYVGRPLPQRFYWKAYGALMHFASGGHNPPSTPPQPRDDGVAAYWFHLYDPANARAGEYAARYRSTYVWIFLLATLALVFGALAGLFHGVNEATVLTMAGLELLMLVAIFLFVIAAMRFEWHEHSIEYRLLAELCRKQQVLAPLGRAVSLGAVRHMGAPGRAAWVAWFFAAYRRTAPLPRGDMAAARLEGLHRDVLEGLIEEQSQYHKARGEMARPAGAFFERWGERIFLAVFLVFVPLELAATRFDWNPLLGRIFGFLAIAGPAVSASLVGIRSYAELQLLAEQSRHMRDELDEARSRIEQLNLARPMVSQDLGAETEAVATLMLQDLEGWARLFWGKAIENP